MRRKPKNKAVRASIDASPRTVASLRRSNTQPRRNRQTAAGAGAGVATPTASDQVMASMMHMVEEMAHTCNLLVQAIGKLVQRLDSQISAPLQQQQQRSAACR